MAFKINLEKETIENTYFRNVVYTASKMQLVLMSLDENTNIPMEIHEDHDQFIRIEKGTCEIITQLSEKMILNEGDAVIIPAGTHHEVKNIGNEKLKLYTLYSPPEHKHGTLIKTLADVQSETSLNFKNNYIKYKSKIDKLLHGRDKHM